MRIDHPALLQTFLGESEDGLSAMEERLLRLESAPEDAESVGEIFRIVHTLKGDSGSLGFPALSAFAHRLEDGLDRLRRGEVQVSSGLVTLLLEAVDAARQLLWRAADGRDATVPQHEALLDRLDRETTGEGAASRPEPIPGGSAGMAEVRFAAPSQTTLRVGIDRLDALLDLTGELGIAQGRLGQLLADSAVPRSKPLEWLQESVRLFSDLQELVLELRLVRVGPTLRHYFRIVRDLATAQGKLVRLVLEGDDAEIDARVVEKLRDPLSHIVRNAVSHGIETPSERLACGKDATGRITLRARRHSSGVLVEVEDDGAGLRRDQILRVARETGRFEDHETPEDAELYQLIFEPGFSTAEAVTAVAGRGVGMDVVRRNVEALRGSVSLRSAPGKGTRVRIRLPLSLALIEGFLVGVGDEVYVLPVESVVETLDFRSVERSRGRDRGVLDLRGEMTPYVRLRSLFGTDGTAAVKENVVVVHHEGGRAGLVVDRLLGQSQTVIKPLAKVLRGLSAFAGSAVLADGRVALILDVPGMFARGLVARPAA